MIKLKKPKKKNVMEEFEIDEVSQVTKPAQEHALARITKSQDEAHQAFAKAVDQIIERDDCSRHEAMIKAQREEPEAFEAYRKSSIVPSPRPYANSKPVSKSRLDFENLVDGIAAQKGVSRTAAMALARKRHPEAFAAYQSA